MVVRPGRAENSARFPQATDRSGAARCWPRARRAGCSGRRRPAAGSRACRRARVGMLEPELNQRDRHHDAGQPERNERGVIEQLAAGDARAQIDPADHCAEQHRDGGGDGRKHEAVEDRALRHVVFEQDEFVVRERQALPELKAPGFRERHRDQRRIGQRRSRRRTRRTAKPNRIQRAGPRSMSCGRAPLPPSVTNERRARNARCR